MKINNPATVQMLKGIVSGTTPIARVALCDGADNVRSSVGGTPLGEIFEADMKTVKSASRAEKVSHALSIAAGGANYAFDGSADVAVSLESFAFSAWQNGQSGALKLTEPGAYQIYVPAENISEILYLGQAEGSAYGAVRASAAGSVQICVIGGTVYVYEGAAGAFPNAVKAAAVSARKLFS